MSFLKSQLSKINFELGRNPVIEKGISEKFIPPGFKSVITFTADFELAWAWRYSKSVADPLKRTVEKAEIERKNLPEILKLCDKYNIPVTWATVGHLFLNSCKALNGIAHPDIKRLDNFENEYWRFSGNDWFEYDPCTDVKAAPNWYCPDLIDLILNSKTKHEIGCHTFSHIDCSDKICPPEVIGAELNKCKELASEKGIVLKSFVHPGHTIGNLETISNQRFTSYQTDKNILGYPELQNRIWELKRTMEMTWREGWSAEYHIYRYKKIISRAVNSNTVCNLWFHPSMPSKFVNEVLPSVFQYVNELSENKEVYLSTVGNYIDHLNAG